MVNFSWTLSLHVCGICRNIKHFLEKWNNDNSFLTAQVLESTLQLKKETKKYSFFLSLFFFNSLSVNYKGVSRQRRASDLSLKHNTHAPL